MNTHDHLSYALAYADLGYAVFPCRPGDKSPLTEHGFHDATTDVEQIERWWTASPDANIGIPTAGLLVVDIDGRHNPWPGAERSLEISTGPLAVTPRGGSHRWFRAPYPLRSTTGQIAPDVDTRADGGYVVVPPSTMLLGPYAWINDLVPRSDLPFPPDWLLDLLPRAEERQQASGTVTTANMIPAGQRNSTLAKLAGGMRRQGMGEPEILAALRATSATRCTEPLPPHEIEHIARSISRYEPDQVTVAVTEGHWQQDCAPKIRRAGELVREFPELRPVIIDGLLRIGETMNVIAAPKVGKSHLVHDLAMSVAAGRPWMGFDVVQGPVLILDNELHDETLSSRLRCIAGAHGIDLDGVPLDVETLRGRLMDLAALRTYFDQFEAHQYRVIVLDAWYRFQKAGASENDNSATAEAYNLLDSYAKRLGCAFVLIHHSSKGDQSGKAITDVGAGAGAQSRAADTHLVLRPHEEDGAIVLDAAVRSFPPLTPVALRREYPLFVRDVGLDPGKLKSNKRNETSEDRKTMLEIAAFLEREKTAVTMNRIHTAIGGHYNRAKKLVTKMVDAGDVKVEKISKMVGYSLAVDLSGILQSFE